VPIDSLVREVAYLRRLAPKSTVRVEWLSPTDWNATLHEAPRDALAAETFKAWVTAFSLLPPGMDVDTASYRTTDNISAFYNYKRKAIVAPRGAKVFDPEDLAHEIAHALADQTFDIAKTEGAAMSDAYAAVSAFIEGDASAVTAMWSARSSIGSPSAALAAEAKRLVGPPSELATGSWGAFPPYQRENLLFSYIDALRFVAALHRTGGFALVDRAWKVPPWTTEQIFHPEKYLSGEGAIPVASVAAPPNTVTVHEDATGELELRMVLTTCFGDSGVELATGWGGDRYRISRLADGRLALQWAIAWDDVAAAERFEKAAPKLSECWSKAAAIDDARGRTARVAPGLKIARAGANVAIARGLGDDPKAEIDALLASIGAAPPRKPPLGNVSLAPEAEPTEPAGTLVGRRYELAPFGVALDVPQTMAAEKFSPTGLLVRDPNDWLHFAIDVLPTTAIDANVAEFVAGFEKHHAGAKAIDGGRGTVETAIGLATERRWFIGAVRLRMLTIPLCAGLRTLVLRSSFVGDEARTSDFETLLASLTRTNDDPPPACR